MLNYCEELSEISISSEKIREWWQKFWQGLRPRMVPTPIGAHVQHHFTFIMKKLD